MSGLLNEEGYSHLSPLCNIAVWGPAVAATCHSPQMDGCNTPQIKRNKSVISHYIGASSCAVLAFVISGAGKLGERGREGEQGGPKVGGQ